MQFDRQCRACGKTMWLGLCTSVLLIMLNGCATAEPHDGSKVYMPPVGHGTPTQAPTDTAALMQYVKQAAGVVHREGRDAFNTFASPEGSWLYHDTFLFVMNEAGETLYHSDAPQLVNRGEMVALTDVEGRPFVHWQMAAAQGARETGTADTAGTAGTAGTAWAFYKTTRPRSFEPVWVATYTQRVRTPNDEVWVVGGGVYELAQGRALLRTLATWVGDRLQQDREVTLRQVRQPRGPFAYRQTHVVITDNTGHVLAAPTDHKSEFPADLVQWIRGGGEGWHQWPATASIEKSSHESTTSPDGVYAQRVQAGGEHDVVVAIGPLP